MCACVSVQAFTSSRVYPLACMNAQQHKNHAISLRTLTHTHSYVHLYTCTHLHMCICIDTYAHMFHTSVYPFVCVCVGAQEKTSPLLLCLSLFLPPVLTPRCVSVIPLLCVFPSLTPVCELWWSHLLKLYLTGYIWHTGVRPGLGVNQKHPVWN